jgi:hypothetical protein
MQALAAKLQTAAQSGDQNAREWMLDLREIALALQAEESQVGSLLQAMHGFAVNAMQQPPVPYPQTAPGYAPQAPAYGQPGYPQPGYGVPQGTNPIQGFLSSGFGRAVEMGLGFGLGDDLMNKIF